MQRITYAGLKSWKTTPDAWYFRYSQRMRYLRYDPFAKSAGATLRHRTVILLLTLTIFTVACEKSVWPPQQTRLKQIFDQQKATFVRIEQEMVADGLLRMGPAIFSVTASNPALPRLPSYQEKKYVTLFDSTQMYLNVMRQDQTTEFEMMIDNVGPRLYLSRFIHNSTIDALPNCAQSMQQMACGACSIELERNWLLEYSWFPANPDEEARLC